MLHDRSSDLPARMLAAADAWIEAFRIRAYEVDPTGVASIQTLCNFLQEAAGNHARSLGVSVDQLAGDNLTWVLSRLHVQVSSYPRWRETIQVETWPSGIEGLYGTREFRVLGADDQPIALGTSAWLMFDLTRRRPVRMPDYVNEIIGPDRPRTIQDSFPKLEVPGRVDHSRRFSVRYSDLDVNQHVNNVRYIEWAVETLPLDIIESHSLSSIEVIFRAETSYGDSVVGEAEKASSGDDLAFFHRVLREGDNREVAIVHTRWRPA